MPGYLPIRYFGNNLMRKNEIFGVDQKRENLSKMLILVQCRMHIHPDIKRYQ